MISILGIPVSWKIFGYLHFEIVKMCIVFIFSGHDDNDCDYSVILVSNRDEHYMRPSSKANKWEEDPDIVGGRDLERASNGGTWLAISPLRRKLGLLLNLPGNNKAGAKSRGKIVEDYVKCNISLNEYVENLKQYGRETNDFNFVSVELSPSKSNISTYNNVTEELKYWTETCEGFSNSLPEQPLKKVQEGKSRFQDICKKLKKIEQKKNLVEELIEFLKWDERHLPDLEIQRRRPDVYEHLSSVFVCIPEGKYGTRTHNIVLVTKSGTLEFIELTMQEPIQNPRECKWERSEFVFDLS